ncbi:uncharacterized [Tachysurus ichikawai]
MLVYYPQQLAVCSVSFIPIQPAASLITVLSLSAADANATARAIGLNCAWLILCFYCYSLAMGGVVKASAVRTDPSSMGSLQHVSDPDQHPNIYHMALVLGNALAELAVPHTFDPGVTIQRR